MLQKFILNDMAKELTKHERDTLNYGKMINLSSILIYLS